MRNKHIDPRKRHNPTEVRTVPGFPEKLKLYRMPSSRFWYVRMYVKGGPSSGVKKSTGCEKFKDAVEYAKEWYEDRILEQREFRIRGKSSFSNYAERFKEAQDREFRRGNLGKAQVDEDRQRLGKILPVFGDKHIAKIDFHMVDLFIDELKSEKDLSASTLKKYIILIRKVMKEAHKDGSIVAVPALPSVKSDANPRPWFTPEQYRLLLAACRDLRDNPPTDVVFDFGELYDFIVFMVHSFLRPSEWKLLQHKHIRTLGENTKTPQLSIVVPNPKTKKVSMNLPSTTTEVAHDIYTRHIKPRNPGRDDYLFFNDLKDRESWAQDRVGKMFRRVCIHAGLGEDQYGQKHTTYSLRHSSLCFQILKTEGADLFGLAKNARTSVDMLEKFYLSHLAPQMPIFTKQLLTTRALDRHNAD